MPKSLGQIHTCDFNYEVSDAFAGLPFLCDSSAKLSTQFQRNIRMMSTYKWVGADLVVQLPENINPSGDESTQVLVKGRMRYFAPTKGRCNALRDSYQQFKEIAKSQAVNPMKNKLFDFRVLPRQKTRYALNLLGPNDEDLFNLTTLDGTNELSMIDGAISSAPGTSGTEVFEQYNVGIVPTEGTVTGDDFNAGLRTQLGTIVAQTDFVLSEGLIQEGNSNLADIEMEVIPFTLSYDSTDFRTTSLQWRPDPALYISVLGGFVEIIIDEVSADGATGTGKIEGVEMDISLHWAGWKSIVQPPKSRRSKSSSMKLDSSKKNKK